MQIASHTRAPCLRATLVPIRKVSATTRFAGVHQRRLPRRIDWFQSSIVGSTADDGEQPPAAPDDKVSSGPSGTPSTENTAQPEESVPKDVSGFITNASETIITTETPITSEIPVSTEIPVATESPASSPSVRSFPLETDGSGDDPFAFEELVEEIKDQNEFGKRGEAFFLATVAVGFLICFPPMALQGTINFVGTIAITAGVVFMLYGLVSLGRNLSPFAAPRKKHKLVTTGMYSYVRHPLYSGLLLAAFGLAAITAHETRLVLALLLWCILEQKIVAEERYLLEHYQEYNQYRSDVKKLIPFVY